MEILHAEFLIDGTVRYTIRDGEDIYVVDRYIGYRLVKADTEKASTAWSRIRDAIKKWKGNK